MPLQKVTVYMRRKPTEEAVATARAKNHQLPGTTPAGTFNIPKKPVDAMRSAARKEAARRLQEPEGSLLVNFSVDGDQMKILVTAPAQTA